MREFFGMEDVFRFCALMASVTGALATLDRKRVFGCGRTVLDFDIAHIGFGAMAGVIGAMLPKVQT